MREFLELKSICRTALAEEAHSFRAWSAVPATTGAVLERIVELGLLIVGRNARTLST